MLKEHDREKDMFLAGIKPWTYEGVTVPGGSRPYKRRGRKYEEDPSVAKDPHTGEEVRMPTHEPGERVGVPPMVAEALLALLELGKGHIGFCPPPCGKMFVKQRRTTEFCSSGCRDKARLATPEGKAKREKSIKDFWKRKWAKEKAEKESLKKRSISTGHRARE